MSLDLANAALTPSIDLFARDAVSQVGDITGIQPKKTCSQWLRTHVSHMGVGVLATMGTLGTGYMGYGIYIAQVVNIAVGAIFGAVGFSTAGCMWWNIPAKSLEQNVNVLNNTIKDLNHDIVKLNDSINELKKAKEDAEQQLTNLTSNFDKSTESLRQTTEKLEATKTALQGYMDLYLKYQATTNQVIQSIQSIAKYDPQMVDEIKKISIIINKQENEEKTREDDIKRLEEVEKEFEPVMKQASESLQQFEELSNILVKQIIPSVNVVHDDRNQLAEQVKKLAEETEDLKSVLNTIKATQEQANETEATLREQIDLYKSIVEEFKKNAALKSQQK